MNSIIKEDYLNIYSSISEEIYDLNNKSIIIAGGGGFLGYHFVNFFDFLISRGLSVKILVLDNFISNNKKFNFKIKNKKNFIFKNLDITDNKKLKINKKYDLIIHAAGIASPKYYKEKPLRTLDVSVKGTSNLLELAKKFDSKFIFFSSSEIYGDPDNKNIPTKETYNGNVSTSGPRACYDEGKRVGETLCYIYNKYHNVKTCIIRPFNVYGPGMLKNDYRVMPNFAKRLISNEDLHVYSKGKQTRTFCYYTDAIDGFLRVFLKGKSGEIYNIGKDDEEISMSYLAKLFVKTINSKSKVKKVSYPDYYPNQEPQRRCPDISKAKKFLGFNPKVNLKEGILRYFLWLKKK